MECSLVSIQPFDPGALTETVLHADQCAFASHHVHLPPFRGWRMVRVRIGEQATMGPALKVTGRRKSPSRLGSGKRRKEALDGGGPW